VIAAIVVAAGQGSRFGGDVPKQFLLLKDRPLLAHSLLSMENHPAVAEIVVVAAPEWKNHIEQEIISRFAIRKVSAIVPGGKERQDSVSAGLSAVSQSYEFVAVHDAVRPLFSPQVLDRTIDGCQDVDACIPAIIPRDTIKQVSENRVVRTLPRETLRLAQTPQVFRRSVLIKAFQHAKTHGLSGTDEAALVEASGGTVSWVPGDEFNLKITTPLDLKIAEILVGHDFA
jgi:2-C-methyl-D-erythritol 4-phosphate cytidylyltransferase